MTKKIMSEKFRSKVADRSAVRAAGAANNNLYGGEFVTVNVSRVNATMVSVSSDDTIYVIPFDKII